MPDPAPTRVSVICAWYNRAGFIRDTIDSLLSQDMDAYEVIVVNDGSTNPLVRETLDNYDDPRLRVFHHDNAGFVNTMRFAVEQSRAPLIAVQGAGDVSLPARLRVQAGLLEAHPEFAGTGCGIRNIWVGGENDGKFRDIVHSGNHFDRKSFMRFSNPLSHGEVMFRRDIYEAVGGYRPFFHFAQDRDLWLRMSEHAPFTSTPEVLYERRKFTNDGVAASYKKSLSQMRYSYIARECVAQRATYGSDIVDIFGMQAALFRAPQRDTAHDMAKIALKYLAHDMPKNALFLARMGVRERRTPLTLASLVVARTACHSPAIRPRLAGILQGLNMRDFRAPEAFVLEETDDRTHG